MITLGRVGQACLEDYDKEEEEEEAQLVGVFLPLSSYHLLWQLSAFLINVFKLAFLCLLNLISENPMEFGSSGAD